ncbi:unnamed protein product [Lupinus luteus]|uniref:Remorin C-terminal domain-containing protein n=1 Tax=Lupinus luteus TaxID=3873 RepID=A0AAV1WUU7_LUPLU
MGEDGSEKTESKSESVVFVTTQSSSSFPTPPHQSPLHEGDEPKSPRISKVEDESPDAETDTKGSVDRGDVHARVEEEKRLSLIKAWEDNEKTKVENGAYKRQSSIGFWEDSKKASVEANLKKFEEKLERRKAEFVEKMQNKIAQIHLIAEERKATIKAKREEKLLKVEETAAKFRSSGGYSPRKLFPCFGG